MDKEFWIFLGVLVTAFSGALKLMWDALKRDHVRLEKTCEVLGEKSENCEKDRKRLHDEVSEQGRDLRDLRKTISRCTAANCPARDS